MKIVIQVILCIVLCLPCLRAYTEDSALYYGEYSDNIIIIWGFQELCDYVDDLRTAHHPTDSEGVTFDPKEVKKGDLVLVREIERFMQEMHPYIEQPYIMITAGVFIDQVKPVHEEVLAQEKIIAWFSVHPCCEWLSEKFIPLPLGIIQHKDRYDNRAEFSELFAKLRKTSKEHLLYMNFRREPYMDGELYPDRDAVYDLFKDVPYCYQAKRKKYKPFMKDMAGSKFVLSPAGLGPDCYRTWEALLVGSIPIVKTAATDALYEDLPVLIVNDWEDITEELLERTWEEFAAKRFTIEKLFMEYWAAKIYRVRDDYLLSI